MKEEEEKSDLINNSSKGSKEQENQIEELKIDKVRYKIERNIKTPNYDKSIKVILLGDSMVGKSSIINRLIKGNFEEDIKTTISIEYYNYYIKINNFIIRMQMWDTAGQEKYDSIVKKYYENTDVGIYVYSIDNENSFNRIKDWLNNAYNNNKKLENNEMKNILLGNKKDLDDSERKITYNEAQFFAKQNNFLFFREISCKDDDEKEVNNLMEVFDVIAKTFYDAYKAKRFSSLDSENFDYVASKSMMEMSKKGNSVKKKKKKECC